MRLTQFHCYLSQIWQRFVVNWAWWPLNYMEKKSAGCSLAAVFHWTPWWWWTAVLIRLSHTTSSCIDFLFFHFLNWKKCIPNPDKDDSHVIFSKTMNRHAFTLCTHKNIQISSKKQQQHFAIWPLKAKSMSVIKAIWLRVASSHLKPTYVPSVSDNSWPNYGFQT